jgi:hypothetical protein
LQHALYLISGEHLERKVRDGQRIKRLLQASLSDDAIMDELWLAALSRFPTDEERQKVRAHLADRLKDAKDNANTLREQAWQDVLWALLNTKEFLFNH